MREVKIETYKLKLEINKIDSLKWKDRLAELNLKRSVSPFLYRSTFQVDCTEKRVQQFSPPGQVWKLFTYSTSKCFQLQVGKRHNVFSWKKRRRTVTKQCIVVA